jgi:TldD protein
MKKLMIALMLSAVSVAAQQKPAAVDADPVLKAMSLELERSKRELKLPGQPAPYYIEYRMDDLQTYEAAASAGALTTQRNARGRVIRAVVRVGDYTHDSYMTYADGSNQIEVVDDDLLALRHQIWLATDQAYKIALEALSYKKAAMQRVQNNDDVPDFSKEQPNVYLGEAVHPKLEPARWVELIKNASALHRNDADVHSVRTEYGVKAENTYFINSEGSMFRSGQVNYAVNVFVDSQAPDGMRLERSKAYAVRNENELPDFATVKKDTEEMIASLTQLRAAPVLDDDYQGPVLFSGDSATSVFEDIFTKGILADRPEPGKPGRTVGPYSGSYKTRVLPEFLTVVDDPTVKSFEGHSLYGSYDVDDDGVKARPVTIADKGILTNYLTGREPIKDFLTSNGHARAAVGTSPKPSLGNLFVKSLTPLTQQQLMDKMMSICKDQGHEYCYYVETTAGLAPRLLWRIYTKDGHRELVRGGSFDQLDTRAIRSDIVAAGDDYFIDNLQLAVAQSVVSPSLLFGELTVKRSEQELDHLPYYPAPVGK